MTRGPVCGPAGSAECLEDDRITPENDLSPDELRALEYPDLTTLLKAHPAEAGITLVDYFGFDLLLRVFAKPSSDPLYALSSLDRVVVGNDAVEFQGEAFPIGHINRG